MGVQLECKQCSTGFSVPSHRKDTAKFCSRQCAAAHPKLHHTTRCRECGVEFKRKPSHAKKNAQLGNFCGMSCLAATKKRLYAGDSNPNSRVRNFDRSGNRIYPPAASLKFGFGKIKIHHAVTFKVIGITSLPKGLHVHHRDCDVLNNDASNLQVMTNSDHKWLHHQFGVATLKAISDGGVSIEDACQWSDDPLRAHSLLITNVHAQAAMHKYLMDKFGKSDIGLIAASKPVRAEIVLVEEFSETVPDDA